MNFTRIAILAVFAFVLAGCGRSKVVDVGQFASYVTHFESVATEQGKSLKVDDLIMKFGPMDYPTEQGFCTLSTDQTPTITLNEASWDLMDESEREALVFHELGHCVLIRRHDSSTLPDGDPASMMNPYSMDSYTYEHRKAYYQHELFQNALIGAN